MDFLWNQRVGLPPNDLQRAFLPTLTNEQCREDGMNVTNTEICTYSRFLQGACGVSTMFRLPRCWFDTSLRINKKQKSIDYCCVFLGWFWWAIDRWRWPRISWNCVIWYSHLCDGTAWCLHSSLGIRFVDHGKLRRLKEQRIDLTFLIQQIHSIFIHYLLKSNKIKHFNWKSVKMIFHWIFISWELATLTAGRNGVLVSLYSNLYVFMWYYFYSHLTSRFSRITSLKQQTCQTNDSLCKSWNMTAEKPQPLCALIRSMHVKITIFVFHKLYLFAGYSMFGLTKHQYRWRKTPSFQPKRAFSKFLSRTHFAFFGWIFDVRSDENMCSSIWTAASRWIPDNDYFVEIFSWCITCETFCGFLFRDQSISQRKYHNLRRIFSVFLVSHQQILLL